MFDSNLTRITIKLKPTQSDNPKNSYQSSQQFNDHQTRQKPSCMSCLFIRANLMSRILC